MSPVTVDPRNDLPSVSVENLCESRSMLQPQSRVEISSPLSALNELEVAVQQARRDHAFGLFGPHDGQPCPQ
jgi:hypothetical protein